MLRFLKKYSDTISFSSSVLFLATQNVLGETVVWLEIIFYTLSSVCLLIGILTFVRKSKAKRQIVLELIEAGEIEIYDEKAEKQVNRFKIVLPEPTAIKTSKQMNNILENGARFYKLLILAKKGLKIMIAYLKKLAFVQWFGIFVLFLIAAFGVVAMVNPTLLGPAEPYVLEIMVGLGITEFPSIISVGKVVRHEIKDNAEAVKKETEIKEIQEKIKEKQAFINKCSTKVAQLGQEYAAVIAKWKEDHEFGLTTMTSAETTAYQTYANAVNIVNAKSKEADVVIVAHNAAIAKLEAEIEELRKVEFNVK